MNAKRMFELVNYELMLDTEDKLEYEHKIYPYTIYFNKRTMDICKYARKPMTFNFECMVLPEVISYLELQAINQQVEELGWNYD